VLRDVAIDVRPGEIHALIGQNGSGKSTLAKVLTGLYTPDAGTRVAVDGADLHLPVRPAEAMERGVAVVHQSLGLVDRMSVIENVRVGRMRAHGLWRKIDWKDEREAAEEVFARLGRRIPLDVPVGSLREEERATVAIARAVQDARPGTGLIIFDESTRALGRRSLEHFFEICDDIVSTGTAILMITHRLEEVVDAADRVTVLRDGRVVEQGREVAGMSEADLTRLMLGRNLDDMRHENTARVPEGAEPVRVRGLRGLGVTGVSLEVRPGEVLGITGLAGSGFDDVPYLLSGATPAAAGTLELGGREIALPRFSPAAAIDAGIVLVPEGREHAGLAMGMTVAENAAFPQSCRSPRQLLPFSAKAERRLVEEWIERLDVRPPRPEMIVGSLSGGNAQKVVLAKWLSMEPRLLLLHEPTQAVDVGARHTIVAAVRDAAKAGAAVIVSGSDENELALLCDRVLVFGDGELRQELAEGITPDTIVSAIYTGGSRAPLRQRTGAVPVAGEPPEA
jgi:ribose transport system ATP-binding protein